MRADPAPVQRHNLRLEDVLATEGIGAAQFSPDGHWLAYNLVPPYDQLSDYSYWMRAYGLSGHQLWVKAMDNGAAPSLQPGLDPGATSFLMGFSPGSTQAAASGWWRAAPARPAASGSIPCRTSGTGMSGQRTGMRIWSGHRRTRS